MLVCTQGCAQEVFWAQAHLGVLEFQAQREIFGQNIWVGALVDSLTDPSTSSLLLRGEVFLTLP